MSKSKKRAILALLIVLAITISVTALMFMASAEEEVEAVLTVESVKYDSKVSTVYPSGTTVLTEERGSYQAMLEKLAELNPESETRYTIKLVADAKQTAPVSIAASENAEIRIELDGHKLQSSLASAAITLTGNGTFRVNGGYNALGECGSVICTEGEFINIAEGAGAVVDIKNLDVTYFGSEFVEANGGEVTLRESYVTYAGDVTNAVIRASGATASIKYVDIVGSDLSTALYLSGAKGYVEGGYIFTGCLVESDELVSHALLVSVDSETVIAFKVGAAESTTYVLGGVIDISAALASGKADSSNLFFYYGDGSMRLSGAGADPSAYGIQSNCSFTESEGVYTMSSSSTNVAMATTATVGSAPVVTTHSSYVKGMGADGIKRAIVSTASAPTVGINVLLKDAEVASNHPLTGNEYASVIIDLNGHSLTWAGTGAKNFNYAGNMHYTFDGADVDGKVGSMVSNSAHMMLFYPRQASSTGINNEQTVTRVTDTDMVVTNMGSAGSDAFININSGDLFMKGVTLTYTGEKLTDSTTGTSFYMFVFDHDFGPGVNAHLEDVTVNSTYAGERVMNVTAFNTRYDTKVWCNNVTMNGVNIAVGGTAGASSTFIDSELSVVGQVFSSVDAYLYDTTIVVPTGKLAGASAGMVYIMTTDKCATTVSTGENSLSGKYTTDEGYAMVPDANNVYKLSDGIDTPDPITLPAIFNNNMVFQRGKTINVFGYCDDTDAELKITLGDRVGYASVDENGRWYVELDPMEAAWNLTLTIEQTNHILENKVVFTNVAVGEVWVVSGQSNAQLRAGYLEDAEELALIADSLGNIRTYKSSESYSLQPQKYGNGAWTTRIKGSNVKSTSSSAVSALGLATVINIAQELGPDVPVALVNVYRGGTPIEGWIDYEALLALSPSEAQQYLDYVAAGKLDDKGRTDMGCTLYNYQIAPMEGFEVAGVMWYQGCSDISGTKLGTEGSTYTDFFKALQHVYRRAFGNDGDLPFYVMQLAPYPSEGENLERFKTEQYDFCRELDNTYLVSISAEGAIWAPNQFSQGYIHPTRKSPIANRCAYAILAEQYGIKYSDVYTHPDVVSMSVSGSSATLIFDTELKLFFGDTPVGFELSADGVSWVSASAAIDGKSVVLTSSLDAPKYVRYGYSCIHAELADGSIVKIDSSKMNDTTKTISITSGDQTYLIDSSNDLIRTLIYGNVTNASGIPMPSFKLEIK